jgi:signal transduction histidine kinase
MRLILAGSGLLIVAIDPREPNHFVTSTYIALSLYVAYGAMLYVLALRENRVIARLARWFHWLDVVWYTGLIALSSGTNSIFFFGYFFAILVASFRWGYDEGLDVTLASALLFTSVGFVTSSGGAGFELNRFLIRPVYLLTLGYMIAYWGGFEITLKRRLALLKEVSALLNPRFGVDQTVGSVLERIRTFYNSDACIIVTHDTASNTYTLRQADRTDPERAARPEVLSPDLARHLLATPAEYAALYKDTAGRWWKHGIKFDIFNADTGSHIDKDRLAETLESQFLAAFLDTPKFGSVPVRYHAMVKGRLYLTGSECTFNASDITFLSQVFEQVAPIIDNIRLVDRLASDASIMERQRIARDLHDSIIQPYIALHIGLVAVNQKLLAGDQSVINDMTRLIARSNAEIAELRGYVQGLRATSGGKDNLLPAIQRFIDKFAEATGIAVQVETHGDIRIPDRLADEVFQLVVEGLSNIRRHTQAKHATILVARQDHRLGLRIEDEGVTGGTTSPFTPKSMTERALALGGAAWVEQQPHGGSAVIIDIPL